MRYSYVVIGIAGMATGIAASAIATDCSTFVTHELVEPRSIDGVPSMTVLLESVRGVEMQQNAQGKEFSLCLSMDDDEGGYPWEPCASLLISAAK